MLILIIKTETYQEYHRQEEYQREPLRRCGSRALSQPCLDTCE